MPNINTDINVINNVFYVTIYTDANTMLAMFMTKMQWIFPSNTMIFGKFCSYFSNFTFFMSTGIVTSCTTFHALFMPSSCMFMSMNMHDLGMNRVPSSCIFMDINMQELG